MPVLVVLRYLGLVSIQGEEESWSSWYCLALLVPLFQGPSLLVKGSGLAGVVQGYSGNVGAATEKVSIRGWINGRIHACHLRTVYWEPEYA